MLNQNIKADGLLVMAFTMTLILFAGCVDGVGVSTQRLDINSATAKDLSQLPKITAVQIELIITGRPWSFTEELVKKQVLSQREYEAMKDLIVAIQHSPVEGKGEKKKIH